MKAHLPVFTSGPWQTADGDPGDPRTVHEIPVTTVVCRRRDGSGALVRLADRRFALTGSTMAMGPARKLRRYLRRVGSDSLGEDWYEELCDSLAPPKLKPDGRWRG